jgi:hypothetical protein
MIKIIRKNLIIFFIFITMFPLLALATVTTSDLASKSFGNTCAFANNLDDLASILQNNLCGTELSSKQDIAQCSRMALTQYTLCRYVSVLNNSTTSITPSSAGKNATIADNEQPLNYSPNITTANDNNKTSNHKVFNWF